MLLELADGGRFEMVGFGDAEGFGRLPGGIAVAEPCMHATMGQKLAQALQLACALACARRHTVQKVRSPRGRYADQCVTVKEEDVVK